MNGIERSCRRTTYTSDHLCWIDFFDQRDLSRGSSSTGFRDHLTPDVNLTGFERADGRFRLTRNLTWSAVVKVLPNLLPPGRSRLWVAFVQADSGSHKTISRRLVFSPCWEEMFSLIEDTFSSSSKKKVSIPECASRKTWELPVFVRPNSSPELVPSQIANVVN